MRQPETSRPRAAALVRAQQDAICRALQDGEVFERAGVNSSVVHGTLARETAASLLGGQAVDEEAVPFFAASLSLVLHPRSPLAPTAHANYRYFEVGAAGAPGSWWFGGGADLTPSYLFEEDVVHFHRVHKEVCDRFDPAFYPRFKAWCDQYFSLGHRGERRGVGG